MPNSQTPDIETLPTPLPRGRRRGPTRTREAVLDAARRCFAEQGYGKTTIRQIAREAAVDPSLVLQYFESKEHLFQAALQLPFDPTLPALTQIRDTSVSLGTRIVRLYLELWQQPGASDVLTAMFTNASAHGCALEAIQRFMWEYIVKPTIGEIRKDHRALRLALAVSSLIGVIYVRYMIKVGPVAELPSEVLVSLLSPTIDRFLTGELELGQIDGVDVDDWRRFFERQQQSEPCSASNSSTSASVV